MTTDKKKYRIANWYESRMGRNDGSPLYYTHALRNLGHTVMRPCSQFKYDVQRFGKVDFHLWVDWGEDALRGILPFEPVSMKDEKPSVYITSDTHLGFEYRLKKAREFDYVYCNQKRAVEEFEKNGVKAKWLPHAVEPIAYPSEPECIKKYDIGFVGFVSFQKRAEMLDELFKAFPNFWYGQRFSKLIYGKSQGGNTEDLFKKSRIVFNTAAVDDINMRVFETLATKSFLLTEYVPTLHELFTDGEHLVTYKSIPEAIEKAKYYIEHEDEREKIALAGYEEVIKNHTYEKRIETILRDVIGE